MAEENTGSENTGTKDIVDPVPRAALEDERTRRQSEKVRNSNLERENAELRGRVEGMSATARSSSETHKELNHAELRLAVDEGKITDAQADEIRDKQITRSVTKEVGDTVKTSLDENARLMRVGEELAGYTEAIPDLRDKGSDTFARVQKEFDHLVSLGQNPDNLATQAAAVRAAFGPLDDLKKIRAGKGERETHTETGGRGGDEGDTKDTDGWPKTVSTAQRRYYDDLISKGVYADRKAALAELSYKPKNKPRRAA